MTQLERVLLQLHTDLLQLGVDWAVVGGFAVSIRSRPRTTYDIDVAVSVVTDRDAENLIRRLRERGYVLERIIEQEATGNLAGARLVPPAEVGASASIDLLFASSGIEVEIVAEAERLEVVKGALLPVARVGHLIALKVLADQSDRPQDRPDAIALLGAASSTDRELARASLERIERLGFHRGKDLQLKLQQLVQQVEAKES